MKVPTAGEVQDILSRMSRLGVSEDDIRAIADLLSEARSIVAGSPHLPYIQAVESLYQSLRDLILATEAIRSQGEMTRAALTERSQDEAAHRQRVTEVLDRLATVEERRAEVEAAARAEAALAAERADAQTSTLIEKLYVPGLLTIATGVGAALTKLGELLIAWLQP